MFIAPHASQNDPLGAPKQILQALSSFASEIKHVPASGVFEQRLESIRMWLSATSLEVDVAISPGATELNQRELLEWISPLLFEQMREPGGRPKSTQIDGLQLSIWDVPSVPPRRAGLPLPPILAIAVDSSLDHDFVEHAISGHSAVAITAPEGRDLAPLIESRQLTIVRVGRQCDCDGSLKEWLSARGPAFASLLRAIALCDSLHSLVASSNSEAAAGLLSVILEHQLETVRTQSAAQRNRLKAMQQANLQNVLLELTNDLRTLGQQHFDAFERRTISAWTDLLANHSGPLWGCVEKELQALHLSWIDGAKSDFARIPIQFQQRLLAGIFTALLTQCKTDSANLHDLAAAVDQDLERSCGRYGVESIIPNRDSFEAEIATQLLDRHVRLSREYDGERRRRGIFELVMSARLYWNLLVSFLGFAYFLGSSYTKLARNPLVQIAAVVALVYGILTTVRTVAKERTESEEREGAKAREFIRGSLRQGTTEFQRVWLDAVLRFARAQNLRTVNVVESAARTQLVKRAAGEVERKHTLERQIAALDAQEKSLLALMREREPIAAAVVQVSTQLRQFQARTGIRPEVRV